MSGAIAFIQRHDRGDQLAGVRLVGHRLDAAMQLDAQALEAGPAVQAGQLADWIQRRLAESSHGSRIRSIVIDPEGGICGWIRPGGLSAHGASELLRRSGGSMLLGHADDFEGEDDQGRFHPQLDTPGAGGMQLLAEPEARKRTSRNNDTSDRVAAIAQRDAAVRLMLDELDARGIQPGSTVSLWHALARAWSPDRGEAGIGAVQNGSVQAGSIQAGSIGADEVQIDDGVPRVTAVALVEPSGRVSWVWSQGGQLLACGQTRAALGGDGPVLDAALVGRLGADWLGWSAQLGCVPARMACILPDAVSDDGSADGSAAGMTPGGFASAIASAWPGLAADAVAVPDPLGETLGRLDELADMPGALASDPRHALVDASKRPTRAHRSAQWWFAAILAAIALVCGYFAYGLHSAAGEARAGIDDLRTAQLEVYRQHAAAPASGSRAVLALQQIRTRLEREMQAPDSTEPMPVLRVVDDLMLALPSVAGGDIKLVAISVGDLGMSLVVSIPDSAASLDQLRESLEGFDGLGRWNTGDRAPRSGRLRVSATAPWAEPTEGS